MIFERALVGIDGSEAALNALRLTKRLLVPDGRLHALAVAEVHLASHAGMDAPAWAAQISREAHDAAAAAERELGGLDGGVDVLSGYAARSLLATAVSIDADLVAVGSHVTSRAVGIALGSVATRMIHDAPCSVLVAHGDTQADGFPQRIVVGIDTSEESVEAEVIAMSIGAAYGSRVRPLTATGGRPLPDGAVFSADLDARGPVEALIDASKENDLIVVGSRGLHGLRALGSVAERVAHQAHCPVLIVRGQTKGRRSDPSSHGRWSQVS
jgi:nucleotide-binding universal stress UspA family protein